MLRSLRTRLTLLFAGTLLLATVIAGAASIRLYQSYNRDQTASELRSQVGGAAQYFDAALNALRPRATSIAPTRATVQQIESICGCDVLYTGNVPPFPDVEQADQLRRKG